MFNQFITNVIHSDSFKRQLSINSMRELAKQDDVLFIRSDVLYRIYTTYAQINEIENVDNRPDFYRKCGVWLYYEKFICEHGDEYYYYVKFNQANPFYEEHGLIINEQILAQDPETLTDYVGIKDLTIYNKTLKEKQR